MSNLHLIAVQHNFYYVIQRGVIANESNYTFSLKNKINLFGEMVETWSNQQICDILKKKAFIEKQHHQKT